MIRKYRRPPPRRSERGVAAVETAFSLMILSFLIAAGVHLADAMFTKQRILSATTSVARICMVLPGNQAACANERLGVELQTIRPKCSTLSINASTVPGPANFPLLKLEVTCLYAGAGLGRAASEMIDNAELTLTAVTTVPLARR